MQINPTPTPRATPIPPTPTATATQVPAALAPALTAASAGLELVWSDDFDGTAIDPTKWEVFTGNYGTPFRLQTYTNAPENWTSETGGMMMSKFWSNSPITGTAVFAGSPAGRESLQFRAGPCGTESGAAADTPTGDAVADASAAVDEPLTLLQIWAYALHL